MGRTLAVFIVAIMSLACSRQRGESNANATSSQTSSSQGSSKYGSAPSAHSDARDLLFVPAAITKHLSGTHTVFAIDLSKANLTPLLARLPPELDCLKQLVKSVRVVVATQASPMNLFATNVPEQQTRTCIERWIPGMGGRTRTATDGSYEITTADGGVVLSWQDGVLIGRELGAAPPPTGIPNAQLLELAKQVPADAGAFLLSDGYPEHDIKSVAMWVRFVDEVFEVTARAEGTGSGAAQKWLRSTVEGMKEGFASKQIVVDASWFEESVAEPVAMIEARIPLSAFMP